MYTDIDHYIKSCVSLCTALSLWTETPGFLRPISPPEGASQISLKGFPWVRLQRHRNVEINILSLLLMFYPNSLLQKLYVIILHKLPFFFLKEATIFKFGTPHCILTDN